MIIEIPRGYTFVKEESIIAFEDNGILKIYGRRGKFQDVMYDLTYQLKGRNKCYYCGNEVEILLSGSGLSDKPGYKIILITM